MTRLDPTYGYDDSFNQCMRSPRGDSEPAQLQWGIAINVEKLAHKTQYD
jgi:hypothetical protein